MIIIKSINFKVNNSHLNIYFGMDSQVFCELNSCAILCVEKEINDGGLILKSIYVIFRNALIIITPIKNTSKKNEKCQRLSE